MADFDMKPAKKNLPTHIKDDYEDDLDDAPIVINQQKPYQKA